MALVESMSTKCLVPYVSMKGDDRCSAGEKEENLPLLKVVVL